MTSASYRSLGRTTLSIYGASHSTPKSKWPNELAAGRRLLRRRHVSKHNS
ncbi:hypothetical protein SRABI128_05629 [Microbacterium sp. Bi128]|nr:hypothetical protein SRABI128_05629 [Microbacterium sp. Bi128]